MGYREQLNECTDPVSGDWLEITNVSAGSTDKDQKVNAGRFAILANAQTFTGGQTFAPAAGTSALTVTTPTNQTAGGLTINAADCGSGYGPLVVINRNSNALTPSAGWIQLVVRTGTAVALWVDNTGTMRLNTGANPTNANDTSGTVIGTQTSYAALKTDITPWDGSGALDAVLALPLHSYRFKDDERKREYQGIVINDSDRGAWFSFNDAENQTPALNERNLFGYLIAAIQEQQKQISELKERLHAN